MDHVISYDLARGLHIIAVIAWIAIVAVCYFGRLAASLWSQ